MMGLTLKQQLLVAAGGHQGRADAEHRLRQQPASSATLVDKQVGQRVKEERVATLRQIEDILAEEQYRHRPTHRHDELVRRPADQEHADAARRLQRRHRRPHQVLVVRRRQGPLGPNVTEHPGGHRSFDARLFVSFMYEPNPSEAAPAANAPQMGESDSA